jgi:simple sugar transport system substrate-binding protein
MAGQLKRKEVVFPGVLVTQSFLRENQINSMDDLRAKLPQLNLANVGSASWLRSVTF